MKASVVLIATLISLNGNQARLEEPLGDLLRVGETGTVFYELQIGEELKIVNIGLAEVTESTASRTLIEVERGTEVQTGQQARFEVPLARLSPSYLVRLVELIVEDPESTDEAPSPADESRQAGAELPTDLPADLEGPILAFVDSWREAWQRQDVAGYLACYSERFEPGDDSTVEAWREIRTRRLEAPEFIEVELDEIQLDPVDDDEVRVRFDQTYRSDSYRDEVSKELTLVHEAAVWRILRERSLPYDEN